VAGGDAGGGTVAGGVAVAAAVAVAGAVAVVAGVAGPVPAAPPVVFAPLRLTLGGACYASVKHTEQISAQQESLASLLCGDTPHRLLERPRGPAWESTLLFSHQFSPVVVERCTLPTQFFDKVWLLCFMEIRLTGYFDGPVVSFIVSEAANCRKTRPGI